MDNIVDYLVVGFFVISFLSSIFKKKKKNDAKLNKVVNTTSNASQQIVPAEQPKAKNPFEDFFKSINEEFTKAKVEVSHSEVDDYYEQALQNSDDEEIVEQNDLLQTKVAPLIPETVMPKNKGTISIKSYQESIRFSESKRESQKAKELKKEFVEN